MQVTDIADAAILSQLFAALWNSGVVLVATSNRAPKCVRPAPAVNFRRQLIPVLHFGRHLYEGGLNRHVYMPAFEARCPITLLRSLPLLSSTFSGLPLSAPPQSNRRLGLDPETQRPAPAVRPGVAAGHLNRK